MILLLEQDNSILTLLYMHINDHMGYKCLMASNFKRASSVIRNIVIDTIVLDYHLYDNTCIPLIHMTRNLYGNSVKIVVITGVSNIDKLSKLSIDYILKKPFDIDELENIIINS